MNNEQNSWLVRVYRGLYYSVMLGLFINHYKDPFSTTRISWKIRPFFVFFVAQLELMLMTGVITEELVVSLLFIITLYLLRGSGYLVAGYM